jgi:cell division septation protein DedD
VLSRLLPFSVLLAGCDTPRGTAEDARADSAGSARPIPAVAFRLPARGGSLIVYELPQLEETPWGLGGRTAGAASAIGVDLQGRRLLYRNGSGVIQSLDLVALRERAVGARGAAATLGSDGTLFTVDSAGAIVESRHWGVRAWPDTLGRGVADVFAAPDGQVIVIRDRGTDSLEIATRETGVTLAAPVPEARDRAASFDGDAVAFATDSGLVVVEARAAEQPWFVPFEGGPRAVTFSPSGHRVYVAFRTRSVIAAIDRFTRRERAPIRLPGPAAALRMDPWGRVLLARPEGDSSVAWVISAADQRVVGHVTTSWATDLPAVAESGVLLAREGRAVVARDARTLDSLGSVAGGAADLWFTGRWVPRSAAAAARLQALERDSVPPRGAAPPERRAASEPPRQREPERPAPTPPPAGAPAAPAPAAGDYWVQVTSTRFADGARALADTLRREGHPAQVIAPRPSDDIWRVMAGPYPTRQAADSAGRALNRPYFIVDRSRL